MNNKIKEQLDTYSMEFRCRNCGTVYSVCIPKGEKALGKGGICPYCKCNNGYGTHIKPQWLLYAEGLQNAYKDIMEE